MDKSAYCNICNTGVEAWGYCGNEVKTKYSIIGNEKRIGICPHCPNDNLLICTIE